MEHNDKEIVLEFHLPNFKRSDIRIDFKKNFLTIKAEKNLEKSVQRKDFFHSEKKKEHFTYSTTLPDINPKKAKINFKDGFLKIIVPRI